MIVILLVILVILLTDIDDRLMGIEIYLRQIKEKLHD